MFCGESTGVERNALASCDYDLLFGIPHVDARFEYFDFLVGELRPFQARMSSSVLPENIEPQTTSIQPFRLALSKNIFINSSLDNTNDRG